MHLLVFLMSWSWSTISPGRASRGSCQSFTWVETILPQALPYKCLALPGPCAVTPSRMPQARLRRPMRSGRQGERRRCRHAWLHTPPSQLAGGLGLRGRAWCAVPGVGPGAEAVCGGLQGRGVCFSSLASCALRGPWLSG